MNDPVAVWMRRIKDADGYYGPDKPPEVGFENHGGHPRNMVNPQVTPWASEYINCYIERADLEKCKAYIIDPDTVSESDKLMVAIVRQCQSDWNKETETFFAAIPNLADGSVALKQVATKLLEQARARGLTYAKALAIQRQYELPMLSSARLTPEP